MEMTTRSRMLVLVFALVCGLGMVLFFSLQAGDVKASNDAHSAFWTLAYPDVMVQDQEFGLWLYRQVEITSEVGVSIQLPEGISIPGSWYLDCVDGLGCTHTDPQAFSEDQIGSTVGLRYGLVGLKGGNFTITTTFFEAGWVYSTTTDVVVRPKPVITSIEPEGAAPGDRVVVHGEYFLWDDSQYGSDLVLVFIDPLGGTNWVNPYTPETSWGQNYIQLRLPANLKAGYEYQVVVVRSQILSQPFMYTTGVRYRTFLPIVNH